MVGAVLQASRARTGTRTDESPVLEIVSISETTLAAFAIARLALSLIVLGGFAFRWRTTTQTDQAVLIYGFIMMAILGVLMSAFTLAARWRDRPIQNVRPWSLVLVDSCLAVGVMAAVDAETTPLAWLALLVPVVETAVLVAILPAAIVWLGLSIAFLALRLVSVDDADLGGTTLALAIQQVVAVFLVSGPAALLSDSTRHRINELADARRSADQMADRLRRVAQAANDMTRAESNEDVLTKFSNSAVTIGFDQADIVTSVNESGEWRLHNTHSTGLPEAIPPDILASRLGNSDVAELSDEDPGDSQFLHSIDLASGHAIRITDSGADVDVVLRAWSRRRPANEQEIRSLELLADQAREIHRAAVVLGEVQDHADRLLHEVRHDGLTGLANRNHVMQTLEDRTASGATMAILFIDLDGFKQLNDSHGHRAGDAALRTVADRLQNSIRVGSMAGRMGGDEFIVVMPVSAFDNMRSLAEAAEDLLSSISTPMILDGISATLGASIGVAVHSRGLDADQLISRADSAMYEAKRSGGGVKVAAADPGSRVAS